jgi:hypothetical protein
MWLEDLIDIVESAIRSETAISDSRASAKPVESLLATLVQRFSKLSELGWYEITVENESQGYSLFARTSSNDLQASAAG